MGLDALYPSMPAPATPEQVAEALITAQPATPAAEPVHDSPATNLSEDARLEASGARLFNKAPEPFVDADAPEEVRALREADSARAMYSPQELFKNDLPDADFEAVVGKEGPDGQPFTQEQAVQAAGVWREVCQDMDLAPADVAALVPILKAERPTEEAQAAFRVESFKWLNEAHGDQAGFALQAAQELVKRDLRVAALLDHTGRGDDPRVVRTIVTAALKQVAAGKLKVPR
jgi:hypothetical protein